MGEVISIGIPTKYLRESTVLKQLKEDGYELHKHLYNAFIDEHFFLLRKVGD
jgi:hypothetical protein